MRTVQSRAGSSYVMLDREVELARQLATEAREQLVPYAILGSI